MGSIGILNVGAGDTKLTFDKTNPAEVIRSGRIVRDMLRRGYALLVEVDDGKGGRVYARARDFDENTAEYIIADGPEYASPAPEYVAGVSEYSPRADNDGDATEATPPRDRSTEPHEPKRRGRPPGTRRVDASATTGLAVARSAGG